MTMLSSLLSIMNLSTGKIKTKVAKVLFVTPNNGTHSILGLLKMRTHMSKSNFRLVMKAHMSQNFKLVLVRNN
jgi:hypothetical protein